MHDDQSDPPRDLFPAEQPRCPKCHEVPMLFSKTASGPPGFDYRTFECRNCGRVHTIIVADDPADPANGWLLGDVMPARSFSR
jgi:hypothetical protein